MLKIGLDVDGVLANFYSAYEDLHIKVAGVDLFRDQKYPAVVPAIWDWPTSFGYTKEHTKDVWRLIKESPTFWMRLGAMPEFPLLRNGNLWANELYFITDRHGVNSKAQTEEWFDWMLGTTEGYVPTVLVSAEKGLCCKALKLDFYVDDKAENIAAVELQSETTRAYLLDRPYNQHFTPKLREHSLRGIFLREGLSEYSPLCTTGE